MNDTSKSIYIQRANSYETDDLLGKKKIISKQLGLSRKAVCMQVLMTLLANLTVLSPGMGFSFPAVTFDSLTNTTNPMAITIDQASWYASIFSIALPIGCLISCYVVDLLGRKKTLILINILSILSWGLIGIASETNREIMYYELMIGRFVNGVSAGLASAPGTIYCAEVVHKDIRGKVIIMTAALIACGMLLTYIWGFFLPEDWRVTSMFACGVSVFTLIILMLFVPETPTWLAAKGRLNRAERSLRFFKGLPRKGSFINSELRLDIETLHQQNDQKNNSDTECLRLKFQKPEVYKPFLIMIIFFVFQQLSGVFVVIVYAVQFSKAAGVTTDPFLTSVYIGLCRFLTTFLVGFIMDKLGRRKLAIFSGFTMFLCMFCIFLYVYFEVTFWTWLPVFLLVSYIFCGTLGLLTLPFTMNSELFPQSVRGLATGLTTSFAFFLCFLMIKFYPGISETLGNIFIILFFAVVSLSSVLFTYNFLPETQSKTFDEIKNLFTKAKADARLTEKMGLY